MSWQEKEYDAYTKGVQWAIDHNLPGRTGFRTTDSKGTPIPYAKAIREFVDQEYPIALDVPKADGGAVYKVTGKSPTGDTVTQNTNPPYDVKTRKPKAGDTFPGPQIEEPPGGRVASADQLRCS